MVPVKYKIYEMSTEKSVLWCQKRAKYFQNKISLVLTPAASSHRLSMYTRHKNCLRPSEVLPNFLAEKGLTVWLEGAEGTSKLVFHLNIHLVINLFPHTNKFIYVYKKTVHCAD
jgi:hypothetical protein